MPPAASRSSTYRNISVTCRRPTARRAWGITFEHARDRAAYDPAPRMALARPGTWDPMAWPVAGAYKIAGHDAQHAFWGQDNHVTQSMLHQLALQIA